MGQQPTIDDKSTVIDASKVVDISKYLTADGTLNWEVPKGNWVILRTGMTPTGTVNTPASPEATGYEVDKMSKIHTEKHFYGHMGEILKRIPEADRKCFKVVVQDSYETGGKISPMDSSMSSNKNMDTVPSLIFRFTREW